MSDKMEDLFANVKKMVDSGNIPPEVKQMMNSFQNQDSNNTSNSDFANKSNSNSNNNNSTTDLNNLLNQVSPEMINNLANILNSSGQSNSSGSTNYGNSHNTSNTTFGANNSNSANFGSGSNNFNIDINTIMKMKSIMDNMNNKNDPRANLLYSLKPYLRDSKKEKLDQYVNMLNISKIADIMNKSNNEKKPDK